MPGAHATQEIQLGVIDSAFLVKERLVSGQYGGYRYENCLTAGLTESELWLKPAAWIGESRPLRLPFNRIVCVNVSPGRPNPKVEVVYRDIEGPATCQFFPSQLGAWMSHFQARGIPLRALGMRVKQTVQSGSSKMLWRGVLALAGVSVFGGIVLSILRVVFGI